MNIISGSNYMKISSSNVNKQLVERSADSMVAKTGPFSYLPIHKRPKIVWPNNARVALWVIPNIEVFALNEHIVAGDRIPPYTRVLST
jgi:hypothetical protein